METHFAAMQEGLNDASRARLAEDLEQLGRDAEELMTVTAGVNSESAQAARTKLASALAAARQTAARLKQRTVATAKAADEAIRAHPYQSVGLAFSLGLLLGILVSRKCRERDS